MHVSVEEISVPPSIDGDEHLIAVVVYGEHRQRKGEHSVKFLTRDREPMQAAVMALPQGYRVEPHRHLTNHRPVDRTQEVLVVREGMMRVDFYTSGGEHLGHRVLFRGDIVVLLGGGHSVTALADTELFEAKTGPYLGRDKDKVTLDVRQP